MALVKIERLLNTDRNHEHAECAQVQEILTVTLNPALDLSTYADNIRPGPKLRCDAPVTDAGGGGLNVSRAIAYLGGTSRALAAIGGAVGLKLASILQHEGIDLIPFHIDSETRQSLSVTDRGSSDQYRFVLPGPEWSANRIEEVRDLIQSVLDGPTFVVVSGSNPPGVPPTFIADLKKYLAPDNVHLVADVSGEPLRSLVDEPCGLHMLRMDAAESATLAERSLPDISATAEFASRLVRDGVAEIVVIARGAEGSVMVDADGGHHCCCEVSTVRSKVGAGDSFVAGMVLALAQGADRATALRHGVAAASATVLTEATELCKPEDVLRLLDQCDLATL